jgi:hypothetical protein
MKINRFFTGAVLVLGWLVGPLGGAEFRALSWEGSVKDVTYRGQARGEKLVIFDSGFTPWQKITPGAVAIEFLQAPPPPSGAPAAAPQAEAPSAAKEAPPVVLARVEWPVGVNRALLLFVPAPAGSPTPYGVVVIPEREAAAVPPAIRLFNYSVGPVAVQLGEEAPLQMVPRQIHEDDNRPASGAKVLKLAYREGDEWKIAARQNLAIPPGFVTYIFLRNIPQIAVDPSNPTLSFKLIYDRLPAPPVAPKVAGN